MRKTNLLRLKPMLSLLLFMMLNVVWAQTMITVELRDSDGDLLPDGATATLMIRVAYPQPWDTVANNGNGTFTVLTSETELTYKIFYNYGCTEEHRPTSVPSILFQTTTVDRIVLNSMGLPLNDALVSHLKYASGCGWSDPEPANTSTEVLPGDYCFKACYNNGQQSKNYTVSGSSFSVSFQTVLVETKLIDPLGNLHLDGETKHNQHTGWSQFRPVDQPVELLPGEYEWWVVFHYTQKHLMSVQIDTNPDEVVFDVAPFDILVFDCNALPSAFAEFRFFDNAWSPYLPANEKYCVLANNYYDLDIFYKGELLESHPHEFLAEGIGVSKVINLSGEIETFVWNDLNEDGLQYGEENQGVQGINVELLDASDNLIATKTTNSDGLANFFNPPANTYLKLRYSLPIDKSFAIQVGGIVDSDNCDADPVSHESGLFQMIATPNCILDFVDAGLIPKCLDICSTSGCGTDPNQIPSYPNNVKSYLLVFEDVANPGSPLATVTGVALSNTANITVFGKTFDVHVSCSDPFTGGYGQKDGPTIQDSIRIVHYTIWKYKNGELEDCCSGNPMATSTTCPHPEDPNAYLGGKYYSYEFEFEQISTSNTQIVTGTSTSKTVSMNPFGIAFDVHISCSDDFANGFGQKDGPSASDDAKVISYKIWKYDEDKKTGQCELVDYCGNITGINTCLDPGDPNTTLPIKKYSYVLYFEDGTLATIQSDKHDVEVIIGNGDTLKVYVSCKDGFPYGYSPKKANDKSPDPQPNSADPRVLAYSIWEYDVDKDGNCKKLKDHCSDAPVSNPLCLRPTVATLLVNTGDFNFGDCTYSSNKQAGDAIVFGTNNDFMVYPNPIGTYAIIEYELKTACEVQISFINLGGVEVAVVKRGVESAGKSVVEWDVSSLPNGIYIVKMIAGDKVSYQRVVVAH